LNWGRLNEKYTNWYEGYDLSNKIMSDETKNKISSSHKGKKLNPDHIKKIDGNKGKPKPKPDGFGELISKIVQGTKRSDDSKKKQSITTKETLSKIREKLSEKSKGIKNSNSVRYVLLNTISNEVIEIDSYKSVLEYFNKITNSNKKDGYSDIFRFSFLIYT
jgi:hypothetical protein